MLKILKFLIYYSFLFTNLILAQSNTEPKDPNLDKIQELESKLKADKERIEENLRSLEELKKNFQKIFKIDSIEFLSYLTL